MPRLRLDQRLGPRHRAGRDLSQTPLRITLLLQSESRAITRTDLVFDLVDPFALQLQALERGSTERDRALVGLADLIVDAAFEQFE